MGQTPTRPRDPQSPHGLRDVRDRHAGETIVVCGCGRSLAELEDPGRYVTIGVNDVGRLFDPTYLVVLNPRSQFKGDRFRYVETSRARALFTQLELGLRHPDVVRFRLGRRGGTSVEDDGTLPYTRNSPYVALCLAAYMGATRIGLIGVDFTDHHFFARTGRHPLARELRRIDREYARLGHALGERGIVVSNLSRESRLTAFPKIHSDELGRSRPRAVAPQAAEERSEKPLPRRTSMRVAIEKHNPGIVGDFLDGLATTARDLGFTVSRDPRRENRRRDTLSVVWNGRRHRGVGPALYCEHAWLPRWEYQVSPGGINADSHIAPFTWDGEPLSTDADAALERHLEAIRSGGPTNFQYMQTDVSPAEETPESFLLVPLQMEWDTNIRRHVPEHYRRMQALVDDVSRADPPWPIVFKQHPADIRRGNKQLRLRLRRPGDRVWPHGRGNVHQLLRSAACRGVVSLNSNVVHDAMLWDVPAVVLGSNIWPRGGHGPFFTALPDDWNRLAEHLEDADAVACRRAYAHYLMRHQWTLDDTRDPAKVEELLSSAAPPAPRRPVAVGKPRGPRASRARTRRPTGRRRPPSTRTSSGPRVNVAALDRGWFFEDLKRHFRNIRRDGIEIVTSERPRRDADAWILIRTQEAAAAPVPARTVVQIHDMFDRGLYRRGGPRAAVAACGGVCLTHPEQRRILEASGISLAGKNVLERPIGALEAFRLREEMPPRFTVAWVGRPVRHFGKELKRVDVVVEALHRLGGELEVVLLGERLEKQHAALRRAGITCRYLHRSKNPITTYPGHYAGFDAVVIFSRSEAGPLCLFEALATGVPVVSSPVGWSPLLLRDGENGHLVDNVDEVVTALAALRRDRPSWFDRRAAIRDSLGGNTLESWVEANLDLALDLAVAKAAATERPKSSPVAVDPDGFGGLRTDAPIFDRRGRSSR